MVKNMSCNVYDKAADALKCKAFIDDNIAAYDCENILDIAQIYSVDEDGATVVFS